MERRPVNGCGSPYHLVDLFSSTSPAPQNAESRVMTVTQLTRRVKEVIESGIGSVRVEGEISNHRLQSSGHHYFTLKDAGAQLSCVMFKGSAQYLRSPLADGMKVQASGELSVYEARGQYQMLVKRVTPSGQGDLQARFEELKRRLAAEGLFDAAAKQAIPWFPVTVALVTSPTGAALHDMLNVLGRRAPWVRVIIAPVRVQGSGAEHEIAAALGLLNAESGRSLPHIDTVVLARGGGSLEDLWCFNEEVVARAVFASRLPVISAVGHEIDFTIADFAADLRAPTPSAAAELLAPDRMDLLASLRQSQQRLQRRLHQTLDAARRELDLASRRILRRDAERLMLPWQQRLDATAEALERAVSQCLADSTAAAQRLQHRLELRRPDRMLGERQLKLLHLRAQLTALTEAAMERRQAALRTCAGLLRTLGPQSVLDRGFSCALDLSGRIVRDAARLTAGEEIEVRFCKGRARAVVKNTEA